jgi:hypothetical protein
MHCLVGQLSSCLVQGRERGNLAVDPFVERLELVINETSSNVFSWIFSIGSKLTHVSLLPFVSTPVGPARTSLGFLLSLPPPSSFFSAVRYTPYQIVLTTLTALYAVRHLDYVLGLGGKSPPRFPRPSFDETAELTSAWPFHFLSPAPEPLSRLVSVTLSD